MKITQNYLIILILALTVLDIISTHFSLSVGNTETNLLYLIGLPLGLFYLVILGKSLLSIGLIEGIEILIPKIRPFSFLIWWSCIIALIAPVWINVCNILR